MTLNTESGKSIEIPDYIMENLKKFGNTTVFDRLLRKLGGKDGAIRAFRNSGVNIWIRIAGGSEKLPILELL